MENLSKMKVTTPLLDRQPMCDDDILRLLADKQGRTMTELVAHFHVTQTAIRQRLIRLTGTQSVSRKRNFTKQRGRPVYFYFITSRGEEVLREASEKGTA